MYKDNKATVPKFGNHMNYTKEKNWILSYRYLPFPLSLYH